MPPRRALGVRTGTSGEEPAALVLGVGFALDGVKPSPGGRCTGRRDVGLRVDRRAAATIEARERDRGSREAKSVGDRDLVASSVAAVAMALVSLALLTWGALLPQPAIDHRCRPTCPPLRAAARDGFVAVAGVGAGRASSCPAMMSARAPDEAASGGEVRERALTRWARRARKGSALLAAAALVASPRGARAVELRREEPASVSRDAGSGRAGRRPIDAACLSFPRRKKSLEPPLPPPSEDERENLIDLDALLSKKQAKRYTERSFIFDDALTSKPELQEELEEIEAFKSRNAGQRGLVFVATAGGAVGLVYTGTRVLLGIERWLKQQVGATASRPRTCTAHRPVRTLLHVHPLMRTPTRVARAHARVQELNDIEEEREMTGQYISVDATDVTTSIDPTTGKNWTIGKGKKAAGAANATAAGAASVPVEKPAVPWILRVLGLGGAVSADDDDFWAASPSAASKKKDADDAGPTPPPAAGGGPEGSGDGGAPPTPAPGGGDAGGGAEAADDDGLEDDSSGVDTLDDLLG